MISYTYMIITTVKDDTWLSPEQILWPSFRHWITPSFLRWYKLRMFRQQLRSDSIFLDLSCPILIYRTICLFLLFFVRKRIIRGWRGMWWEKKFWKMVQVFGCSVLFNTFHWIYTTTTVMNIETITKQQLQPVISSNIRFCHISHHHFWFLLFVLKKMIYKRICKSEKLFFHEKRIQLQSKEPNKWNVTYQ